MENVGIVSMMHCFLQDKEAYVASLFIFVRNS